MQPKLVIFGNVLLDFTYCIERNPDILSKYGFDPNGSGELSSELLSKVTKDANLTCDFLSSQTGGSALNTAKSLSFLGESDIIFFGAIGNDENGTKVKQNLENSHLKACLQVIKDHPTGTGICLINKENRSCNANIGASIKFDIKYLQCQNLIEQWSVHDAKASQLFYIEGFFITGHRFSLCKYIVEDVCHSSNGKRIFTTNLSAKYLIESHPDQNIYFAENATILFGNNDEFSKLAEIFGFSNTEAIIAHLIATKPKEINDKIIICTHGAEKILYSSSSQMIVNKEFHFDPVPKEKIADTTGCGDAFVAGFFFAFLRNESIENCVAKGVEVAKRKITSVGGPLSK